METSLPLNIIAPKDGRVEILTGRVADPIPLKKPKKISLEGILQCVGDFVEKRKECFEKTRAHIIANYTERTIVLIINEADVDEEIEGGRITGKLELYPHLDKLGINAEVVYLPKELMEAVKFIARFFPEREEHALLMKNLLNFNAKVKQSFKDENDYEGKAAYERLQEIEHDIPLRFKLSMPLFGGTEATGFEVNIKVGFRGNSVIFWLESVQLEEVMEAKTISLFEAQLSRCADYAIIKQW